MNASKGKGDLSLRDPSLTPSNATRLDPYLAVSQHTLPHTLLCVSCMVPFLPARCEPSEGWGRCRPVLLCAPSSLHGAWQRLSAGLENKGRKGERAGKGGFHSLRLRKALTAYVLRSCLHFSPWPKERKCELYELPIELSDLKSIKPRPIYR